MFEIHNLSIKYGKKTLLLPTSLKFKEGKLYTIYGKSGVGKSSLLNKIGLISEYDPKVTYIYDGSKIDTSNKKVVSSFIAQNIAFIFQSHNLIKDLTVYDNLKISLNFFKLSTKEIEDKIDNILSELGILELKDVYPEDLSGGEEQRVAIARGMITDKHIILADEPTNSLDSENREIVSSLLLKLANKYNKIVIVVSHDEYVINKGNIKLHFEDQKLIGMKEEAGCNSQEEWHASKLKKQIRLKVQKKRKVPPLPLFLLILISFTVSLAVGSINIQSLFSSKYQRLISSSLENGFLVINDSIGLGTSKVIDDFRSISNKEIHQISDSSNIYKLEPYIEFPSMGITFENAENYLKISRDFSPNLSINGKNINLSKNYSVQPLFNTNTTQRQIKYFDRTTIRGIFVSESFIKEQKLEDIVAGSEMTLTYYVPIGIYESHIDKEGTYYKSDGDLYVKEEQTFKILGIVKEEYPFNYSVNDNTLFMTSDEMLKIQSKYIGAESKRRETIDDLPVKEWAPSAVHVTVKDSKDVPQEMNRIKKISDKFSIVSSFENYKEFNNGLKYIKNFLIIISLVMLVLVVAILSFVFFLINRTRKYEVGVLKAMGYSTKHVFRLFILELLNYGKKIITLSSVLLLILTILAIQILQLEVVDIIHFYLTSIISLIFLTFAVLMISGLIPIYMTGKQSIVDAIRKNR
ncbi:ATP-binding cassette domain-containing protein [Streptococcus parasanguinis]|jgi:antimicrobial peptide ABC transporter, permease protein|uniref:ATP-binding cassette domain-containing protein n=1 Tax=Streptococcus parasanguinis TaxID=1318 RepID=UPI0039C1B294